MKDFIKQPKPDREMCGFHVTSFLVFLHWVARIGPLSQDGVAPKACDFDLVFVPIVDVIVKDDREVGILPHGGIEFANDSVDLVCI